MPRWVLVDDTDPAIQYTGPWFVDQGSQDSLGNFGIPYLSTLHGINTDGSFSYFFRGSRVLITATLEFPAPDGPSWQCIVDGVVIPSIVYTTPENRLRYCEEDGLTEDATHNITVDVFVSDQRTFWFDYIQYLPPVDEPINNAAISVDIPDPQMLFGSGWTLHSPGYLTSETGSMFSFTFSGTSLAWFGFYDNGLPLATTTATYSVDGAKPITFDLNGAAALRTGVQYNQIFFQTASLPLGNHSLDVTYQGNSSTAPLTISVVYIQNGTSSMSDSESPIPGTSSSSPISNPSFTNFFTSTSSPEPTFPVSPISNSSKISPAGEFGGIIGAILGGLAIISLLVVGLSQRYKAWRRSGSRPLMAEVRSPAIPNVSVPPLTSSTAEILLVPDTAKLPVEGDPQSHILGEQVPLHDDITEVPRNPESSHV